MGVCALVLVLLTSCSSETSQQEQQEAKKQTQEKAQEQAQPAEPSQAPPASSPSPQPAATAESASSGAHPDSPSATEQHRLRITNYSAVAVTVSLNGEWVGQWESHMKVPLDSVVQGRNELVVEVAGEPTKDVKVWVEASRSNSWTPLIQADFKDKPGTHTRQFVAR
jgi:sRNA-binding protein